MTAQTTFRLAAFAAALLALAGNAAAQTPPGFPAPKDPGSPTPTSPAPAPASPGATPGGGTTGAISLELRHQLMFLHARNHGQLGAAQLAMQQAVTNEVRQLSQKVNNDRTQVSVQMAQIAKERGIDELAAPTAEAQAQSKAAVDQLRSKQGRDFDKAYTSLVIHDYEQDENLLKKMRDSQSGKDAALKGWLDNIENVMEDGLASARQAKVALDSGSATNASGKSAQARTPAHKVPAPWPGSKK
ncbi:MAG: DUF4142 domain-containing protein [Anaeromyxobacter sp.]